MKHFRSCLLDTRLMIRAMQQLISRSHCLGLLPSLLLMLMDWAISQAHFLTAISFYCIVKPPFLCQIPMVSATHWLTPTFSFLAQRLPLWVGIWILSASATTDFHNQKASHYNSGSHSWSIIEWWISSARYFNQAAWGLNTVSGVKWWGRRGEEGVLKVLEIVCKMSRQGEYIWELERVISIWQHCLGCYSARKRFV